MKNYTGQHIDRYRIADRLGLGGMAVVYKAFDLQLDRDVGGRLYAVDTGERLTEIDEINLTFSPDGKLLVGGYSLISMYGVIE